MFCRNCGNKIDDSFLFCPNCGLKREENSINYGNMNTNTINNNELTNTPLKEGKKSGNGKLIGIIISIVIGLIIVSVLVVLLISTINNNSSSYDDVISSTTSIPDDDRYINSNSGNTSSSNTVNDDVDKNINSRTIMIYASGSNLESDGGLLTSDLDGIKFDELDDNINVYLCSGGTEIWHNNYILTNNPSIYKLTNNGFVKQEDLAFNSMGDPKTLGYFLTYSYNNSKTDSYDLIFYNHGLGSLGAINDDLASDFIYLNEFETAFENSPFKNKKLNTIIFRTCLNGNYEIASALAPYSKYLVASEESTIGHNLSSVLGFINDVKNNDSEIAYSEKFIKSYKNHIEMMSSYVNSVYSIVDLRKIDTLNNKMDSFFSKINSNEDSTYQALQKIRVKLYQYDEEYDTVDLYQLIESISDEFNIDGSDLLSFIKNDLVKYIWTNKEESHGISAYYPYNQRAYIKKIGISLSNDVVKSNGYLTFMNNIYSKEIRTSSYSFNLDTQKLNNKNDKITISLTDEEKSNFASANYIIFEQNDEYPDYYFPIYSGKSSFLNKNNELEIDLDNKIISAVDEDGAQIIGVWYDSEGEDYIKYRVPCFGFLSHEEYTKLLEKNKTNSIVQDMHNLDLYITIENNKYINTNEVYVIDHSDNDVETRHLGDMSIYGQIQFMKHYLTITDLEGNFDVDNISKLDKFILITYDINKVHYEFTSLDKNKNYYIVTFIKDVDGNTHTSKPLKIE